MSCSAWRRSDRCSPTWGCRCTWVTPRPPRIRLTPRCMRRPHNSSSRRRSAPQRRPSAAARGGVGKVAEPATRILAVLFADVSGSTTLYEKLGDRAALAAVESVLEILKRAVATNRGRVVKTIGDEVMAVFDPADLALQAAVEMQTRTNDLPAISDVKLGIRIGFHAGPVLEERGDVFGDAVNTAARMAGLAKSGQIITSGPTVDALSPTLREGIRDLDALPVKGKLDEIRVSEVLWQDGGETTMVAPRGAALAAAPAVLRLEYGGRILRIEPGGKSSFVFGRDPGNDLVIADKMA